MKTKNCKQTAEKHLSQSVFSLVVIYKQCSRFHRHSILFSITEDKSLNNEVNRLLDYSVEHLITMYPQLRGMQFHSYELCMIPSDSYRIAPAVLSCAMLLREKIYIVPYDSHICDFSFIAPSDDDDNTSHDDIPF